MRRPATRREPPDQASHQARPGRAAGRAAAWAAGGRAWRWYAAGSVLAVGVYASLLPSIRTSPATELGSSVLYLLLGMVATGAVVLGARGNRPRSPGAWYLVAAGLGAFVLGDLVYFDLRLRLGIERFPSLPDGLYLAGYLLLAGGLLWLVRARTQGRDHNGLVDALIVATGLGLLAWQFVIGPYADDPALSRSARVVSIAYPLMDLLLLVTAVRLVVGAGTRRPALVLLVAGLLTQLAADFAYALLTLNGTYVDGSVLDLGWLVGYSGMAAAALHPSMRGLSEPVTLRPARLSRARVALLVVAGLLPSVLLYADARGGGDGVTLPLMLGGTVVLALLVFARMAGLARVLAQQADANQRLLDRTVRATEQERVQIAADLHDGPIQRLAGVGWTTERARRRLERGDTAAALALLDEAGEEMSTEIAALRRVMADLHPPGLAESGLSEGLRAYVDAFSERTGIEGRVRSDCDGRLDPSRETILYRVAQEALTNVAKHSDASSVLVTLEAAASRITMTVSDDGVGFERDALDGDQVHLSERPHLGLAGMRRRAETAGGTFEVVSRPGEGTTVVVVLPRPGLGPED